MDKKKMKNDRSKGSLTVEAVLFLLPFMFAFLTVINVARFVQAEMLIHHAITQTCKQVSAYSYVMTKIGATDQIIETGKKSREFKSDVTETINSMKRFSNAVGQTVNGDGIGEAIETGHAAGENLYNFFSDPKGIALGVASTIKKGVEDYAVANLVQGISMGTLKKSIGLMSDDPDQFLKDLGIINGIKGLNFSKTRLKPTDDDKLNIQIVVTYKMKNLMFPDFDFGQHEFCQCASTLIW